MKTKLYPVITLLVFMALIFVSNGFTQQALLQPSVRLIYFLPNDRPARPERIEALRQLIKDAQVFYADEMERHGYGRKTFTLETDRKGEPVVHRVDGKFTENYYYEPLSDPKVWEELYEHFDDFQHIYFIAIDLSHEVLNGGDSCGLAAISFLPVGGYSPLLARKIAVRHRHETRGEEALGGCSLIPVSGPCFEGFHVTLHELGHTFGLEHDFREGIDSHYVMSFGRFTDHQMRLSECAAEWLSVSPFFNNPKSGNSPGAIRLISTPTYSSEGIKIRFQVTDADGLHQAQFLVPDFYKGTSTGAERLFDCKQLTGKTSTVEFSSEALTIEPVDRLMLQIIDVNGSITWATFLTDIASLLPPPKVVSIPDPNLAAAIRMKLGLTQRDVITDREMQKLRSLNFDDRRITNTSGLEYATQLETLFLGRNQINNYAPLARLPKLKRLHLWANGISDLSVLPPMPQLEFLDLNWNQISDLSPLAEFTSLKKLWLQGNNLADTSTLFQLHSGTFPADEEVEVVTERDNSDRAYTLLIFQSLDLNVRVNPAAIVFRSLNDLQNTRKPVPATDVVVEESPPITNVVVESAVHPPMYWTNAETGTLHRLVETEIENLAQGVRNATDLAIDMTGGKLYWTERTSNRTGKIRRANLDGTNVQLVKELTSVPHSIALDAAGSKIYLTNSWGKLQRLNVDGSNFQSNLIINLDAPNGLALDVVGSKVYWSEVSGRIRRANLDGSSVQNVATNLAEPLSLAIANGKIYWIEKTQENSGKLQRANLNGTNREVLTTMPIAPTAIAVDTEHNSLYLTIPAGEIHRRHLNGSGYQPIVTGLVSPSNIVLGISVTDSVPTDTTVPPAKPVAADVNQDKNVNKTDLLLVVTALGENPPTNPRFDVNADGAVTIADVLLVIETLDDPVAGDAPTLGETVTFLDPRLLTTHLNHLRAESDGSIKYERAIAFFQGLLASIRPTETQLLTNYPNPFNPETWIPYQLATPADVHISIYTADGKLVRTLDLGHQPVGIYQTRNRAAYWDGENMLGEPVASGVYFYTLKAGDFTATQKMLIRK